MAVTGVFVNVAVTDLDRAKAFYVAIGFTINPKFTDHNAACVVIEDGHSYMMIQTREFFQTMTELPIDDPANHPTAGTSVFLDSREAVDTAVTAGITAGGSALGEPQDFGFMYLVNSPTPTATLSTSDGCIRTPQSRALKRSWRGSRTRLNAVVARDYGQFGGISHALALVDERWAMLIVRDLPVGPRRYSELAEGLPRIPTNILATRLKELQAAGVLRRAPRSRVIVYQLTKYGRELEPVVLALGAWGLKTIGQSRDEQSISSDSMTCDLRTAFQPRTAATLPPTAYAARFDSAELLVRVDGAVLEVTRGSGPADVSFAASRDIYRLISGELAAHSALETGVTVLGGNSTLVDRFAQTFRVAA